MGFIRFKSTQTEYAGESFAKTLLKKDGSTWDSTDIATYSLIDTAGVEKSSGDLTKSTDNISMSFIVPSTDTVGLIGRYKLLVSLKNSSDTKINDVIAEYAIKYEERKA